MRPAIRLIPIIAAIIAALAAQAQPPSLRVGDTAFTLGVTEGLEATPVAIAWRATDPGWEGADEAGLAVTVTRTPTAGLSAVQVDLRNAGDARRLLELTLTAPVRLDPQSARYWDGSFRVIRPIAGEQTPDEERARGSWPLAAAGDAERAFVLGITPDT